MEQGKIKLGGLWENKTKDGKVYYSGNLGSCKILIFENGYREAENHPTHIMYIAPNEKKEGDFKKGGRDSYRGGAKNLRDEDVPF